MATTMTPEVCIELHYPAALEFLQRHGPQAVAVVHDLVAHSHSDHGQLVVQASVRQITERLSSLSKDTVHRHMRALLLDGVLQRLVLNQASRFEAPTYVLNLTGSGISRASSADPASA